VFPVLCGKPCDHAQHIQVAFYLFLDARAQQFDHDLLAVLQLCRMHLRNGCCGEWLDIKTLEDLFDRFAVDFVEDGDRLFRWKRWHAVLQFG
jgi:hypothetical protein